MNKKIRVMLALMIVIIVATEAVYATDWWRHANSFISSFAGNSTQVGNSTVGDIVAFLSPLVELVKLVGNIVFVGVTVVLGVKYIWGSVESKADVKDSLMTLIVAAIVFYGWNTISALFMTGDNLSFIESSAESTAWRIYNTVLYVCNFLAIGRYSICWNEVYDGWC